MLFTFLELLVFGLIYIAIGMSTWQYNNLLINSYYDMEGIDSINTVQNRIYINRFVKTKSYKIYSILLWPISIFFAIGYAFGEQIYLYKTNSDEKAFMASWFEFEKTQK